ncbi:RNA-directed DNA polymerase, eukaryota, reverse transcriptase zinc-binding domain protein [Tanacetum coccineum]
MGDQRPKEDGVYNIFTSIFVTNFPDQTNAKELWRLCNQYGNVIDSFIPNRRSKVGKRFGFVRFIKIYDVERLVNNLCTIWIGNFKLHANIAKFNRTPLHKGNHLPNIHANVRPAPVVSSKTHGDSSSYIQAVKAGVNLHSVVSDAKVSKPALLLDDSCLNVSDYSLSLVGKLKEFSSLPNLKMLLVEEGFTDLTISYLGGFWVSFQFLSKTSKENFMSHVGVNSWFIKILQGSSSFVVDERVTWIDIEGVPLCVWSHNTFSRIASIWGSLLYDEDEGSSHFHRKRLCIKTTFHDIISDSFKIIVKGKVFWIRAKELTGWAPNYSVTEDASDSDDESVDSKLVDNHKESPLENDSESEVIPETVFEGQANVESKSTASKDVTNESPKDHSEDPFNIYDLLNKKNPEKPVVQQSAGDLKFPPGFTPSGDVNQECTLPVHDKDTMASYKEDTNVSSCSGHFHKVKSPKTGGSMLQVIEDLIKVGQTMGYKMEGCMKDIEEIETKMELVDLFSIRACWGNLTFDYVFSPSVGNSGGILCVWDSNMFHKENSSVSDYFVAIMGKWRPNNKNLLIISVYAPQDLAEKKMLWQYLNILIDRWNGDVIVMGDFNEVRHKDERYGFIFHARGADAFNSFISAGGLLEVPSGGYSFTWSHNSALKMSKLDRFLVYDNLQRKCPNLSSLTLDRFLSDHRPILLRELNIDYGPTPFRFFHNLFELEGFDAFVADTWQNITITKSNAMIKLAKKLKMLTSVGVSSSIHLEDRLDITNHLSSLDNTKSIELAQKAKDLERVFVEEEIKEAVWDCGLDKSPGPDGFTFGFFRRFWNLIEGDVVEAVNHLFNNGFRHSGGNSSFIALIPKFQGVKMVNDYRPISLIDSLYKIITKLLTNRLVTVIDGLVNEVQSAFIANRQILDGPFILNEIIHWCKAKKKQTLIFKVDFEKAFDSVRWDFLDDVLKNLGFGSRWRDWIQSCLNYSKGSILVNGSPTSEFQYFKGLKQSLIAFLISHLFYADDVVFIGQWCDSNISTIIRVLDCFFQASGMRINLHKSKIMGIAVDNSLVTQAANSIGCLTLSLPFQYLGVNIGSHMSRIKSWDIVLNKVQGRLSKWKSKVLSVGGRLTLLKSVLGATPIYYMSMYKAPMYVINKLEAIRSHFFNGGDPNIRKMTFVKWENVLASKDKGGMGVSSFFALNRALIFKWIWRFHSQGFSLWSRVIKAIHGVDGKLGYHIKPSASSNWIDIVRTLPILLNKGIDLLGYIKKKVGNGEKTLFWYEPWKGDVSFNNLFPRLFALELDKKISVAGKMAQPSLITSFRRNPRSGTEASQMAMLTSLLEGICLPNMLDRWCWSLSGDEEFSVSSARILIDDKTLGTVGSKTHWCKYVPLKVNILSWRVKLNNLPTRLNLSRRGMDIQSILCPSCNLAVESTNHIFFSCPMMKDLYKSISRWWDVNLLNLSSYDDWWEWFSSLRLSSKLKLLMEGSRSGCSVWIVVLKAIDNLKSRGVDLMEFCNKVNGNGNNSKFWQDKWLGQVCFNDKFHKLFNLELQKDISVSNKLIDPNLTLTFRRRPRAGIEESQLLELAQLLSSVTLSSAKDRWT